MGVIPTGGQISPKTSAGEALEWKKAQKKPKNNITSDTMNNKKPQRKPVRTTKVCKPAKVASLIISKNQKKTDKDISKRPKIKK